MSDLLDIALENIRIEGENLRSVRIEDKEFIELRDSVQQRGVMLPIVVSPRVDVDGNSYYLLVDGAHRFTAAQHLGLETIPAKVDTSLTDTTAVLEAQIAANSQRAETRPAEYAASLQVLAAAKPMWTMGELAASVQHSEDWVRKMLSLNKIKNEVVVSKINDGSIPVLNAYQLARLSPDDQVELVDAAMTEKAVNFKETVNQRIKDLKEASASGEKKPVRQFVLKPIKRKDTEIKALLEDTGLVAAIISENAPATLEEAFTLAIEFCYSIDPATAEQREREWKDTEAKKAEKAEKAKLKKQAERAERRRLEIEEASDAAAEAAAGLSEEDLKEIKAKAKADYEAKKAKKAQAEAEAEIDEKA